jgi:ATP-dependent Clp protease ATP-binding subunit ClpC
MSKNKEEYLEKLSENARLSIRYASHIADELFEEEVMPLHIFVGVILNKASLASRTLQAMGVDIDRMVDDLIGVAELEFDRDELLNKREEVQFSDESKDVLRVAYAIANRSSHVYVGTEHLILSILRNEELEVTEDISSMGLNSGFFKENLANFATYPIGILAKPDVPERDNMGQGQLDSLARELVDLARKGQFDPLVGREDELKQIINVLSRRRKNNPVVVGDPGVGKTAIVEGLAQLIAAGTVPNSLMDMKIYSLDVSALIAGSKLRGDVEEKVLSIINEVTQSSNIILFIDEIHNILGTNFPGGGMDIASVLKPALLQDQFRVIGATTSSEFSKYFEEDNALARRFQPIFIDEPSIDETVEILHRVEPILEKHHNVNITDEAIVSAAQLSDRYVSDRFLPDKAIDLLDEASASRRLQLELKYSDLAEIMSEYKQAIKRKEKAVFEGNMKEAQDWKATEKDLKQKLSDIQKKRTRSKYTSKYKVDVDAIQSIVSKWTGIPATTISNEETKVLKNLDDNLSDRVVGQMEAVESVSSAIKRARTGISDVNRPWASMLFLGPTGVGKTELAKVLTEELFGDEDRLIQIDMSEMMEMHSVSKLIGSPPGYVGYREGGQLTEQIRKRPHSVILFDEIEKAHEDVLNILLQIMEYGHLTDGKGRRVDFKNTVIILTSNIGAEEIRKDKVLGFGADAGSDERDVDEAFGSMKEELMRELKDTLRPELLNRMDDVVIFKSLSKEDAAKIVRLLVDDLNDRLEERKVTIELEDSVVEYIVETGFSEEYGARNLRRALQDSVESALADYLLDNKRKKKLEKLEVEELKAAMDKDKKEVVIESVEE